ncbi:MAG TPA: acylneuraminate cytidylyltransferase family protein [Cytophagaceae bacterium]|jgi:CMP-N-acetylneuraminic acid synthetase|nr:acylneuraminate cytidylyltransferase family protein [Cytophagaceae bacterium]
MNIIITICARGGSKGIPGKNIKPINKVPLIGYSIIVAKQFAEKYKADIALSTDSDEIKNAARQLGVATDYKRPDEFATDKAGKMDAIRHVKEYYETSLNKKYDLLLDLDVTSPLRTLQDLEEGMQIILNDPNCLSLFSVNPAKRNPYFNMVEKGENGYYRVIKKLEGNFLTRQSAPKVYDLNASFYFYKKVFFEQGLNFAITERSLIYEMKHICFDLDEVEDFDYMEYLLETKKWLF